MIYPIIDVRYLWKSLKVLKNYQINEFLLFLADDIQEHSKQNLLKLARILKENPITFFADTLNIGKLRVRIMRQMLLANFTDLGEIKLLLELFCKRVESFCCCKN